MMNAKRYVRFVSLMFHHGASMPNHNGLLQGEGKQGRTLRFTDTEDIEKKEKKRFRYWSVSGS